MDAEQKKGFEIYFVIVPEPDLFVRVKSKDTGKKSKYRFHFKLSGDNKKVHDIRESSTEGPDYSGYLNA